VFAAKSYGKQQNVAAGSSLCLGIPFRSGEPEEMVGSAHPTKKNFLTKRLEPFAKGSERREMKNQRTRITSWKADYRGGGKIIFGSSLFFFEPRLYNSLLVSAAPEPRTA
jgi:hypothetical protein